ncbi:transcription elongation factor GreA [Aeromicrobium wangtongii]|uniref:Transcription elongation factor GreA n=1 Tax=Aeromicrobium wangtongii TaxID=2969247 RepID=A0ABY5M8H4_9ACTN|nr:transcription elongation factor GreA [Aeromicrobium wangtongii]MCD9196929.1 transcription elongation factor GreA [Aeromicrobium wangtongii]MCL3817894.1 transcription elongation factor GreA [Aeromicrobium wangtongii]UUP14435.1 transcription elongation factor GreA [Aeromicrobium wangtongii]
MTQPTETDTIWVTQEAYDRLQKELEHLKGDVWADITAKIAAARDEGDLKENGGYHAAREEQGKTKARIDQLEAMLRRAEVGEKPADDGLVEAGMIVTVRFEGDSDTERFLLGSRELLSMDSSVEIDVYSPTSPLGAAIAGKSVGDTVSFETPNGKSMTVEIVDAKPF